MRNFLKNSGVSLTGEYIDIPLWVNTVKIDVGLSTNAPQSQIWLDEEKKLYVIGFEPLRSNIATLALGDSSWRLRLSPKYLGTRMMVIPCALANEHIEGGLDFFVTTDDPGCSSLYEPVNFEVASKERVEVWSLNEFLIYFPFFQIPQIDHLKIDAQGADFEIIKGASHYLNRIFAVTIELDSEQYLNQRTTLNGISKYLEEYGFKLIKPGFLRNVWFLLKGYKIDIETEDPTFINWNLIELSKTRRFFIYQRG